MLNKTITEDTLKDFKKRIEKYNQITDPVKKGFEIRYDTERIRENITYMQEYQNTNNTLLYSKKDIPVLTEELNCILELTRINPYTTMDILLEPYLKLPSDITKKELLKMLLENEVYLIDSYEKLIQEIFQIMNIK